MRNNKDKDTIQFESTPSLDVGIRGSVEFTTMQVMGRYFTKFTVPDINSPLVSGSKVQSDRCCFLSWYRKETCFAGHF